MSRVWLATSSIAVAARLHAQYPDVPPPPPCEPAGAHWSADDVEPAPDAIGRRIAVVPFVTGFSPSDTASADLVAAFSRRLVSRLEDFRAVPLWGAKVRREGTPGTNAIALGTAARARYVMFGVVEPGPSGVQLTVRIFDSRHGAPISSTTYTGSLADLATFEGRIVHAVALAEHASAARHAPGSARPTTSGAAYLLYLRGDADLHSERLGAAASAMNEFSDAVARDSTFAAAWAGLAMSAVARLQREGGFTAAQDSALLGVATYALHHATDLAPQSAATWIARAVVLEMREPRAYGRALTAYQHAVELAPWSAELHRRLGRALIEVGATSDGVAQLHEALRVTPGDPPALDELALLHLTQHNFHEACHAADAAIRSDPHDALAFTIRAFVRLRLRDIRLAYADAETGTRLGAWLTGGVAAVVAAAEARDTADAKERLAALVADVPNVATIPTVWTSHYLGAAYATLNQSDRALALLGRARPRGASLWWALHDPLFDALRFRGAFGQLIAESEPLGGSVAAAPATPAAPAAPAAPTATTTPADSGTPAPLASAPAAPSTSPVP